MTNARKKDVVLNHIPYIHYPLCLRKDKKKMLGLINLRNEVNVITPAYASKLGLKVRPTNVRVQNVDGFTLKNFSMILVSFQVEDKLGNTRFFQEIFLVANTSIEVIFKNTFPSS